MTGRGAVADAGKQIDDGIHPGGFGLALPSLVKVPLAVYTAGRRQKVRVDTGRRHCRCC